MKFILNIPTWRSGGLPEERPVEILGEGDIELGNTLGYSCCLGQFCRQLGVDEKDLTGVAMPMSLPTEIISANKALSIFVEKSPLEINVYECTDLAMRAAGINDDTDLTVEERIEALQDLFHLSGHEIEVAR